MKWNEIVKELGNEVVKELGNSQQRVRNWNENKELGNEVKWNCKS
jgi:hypothetical protein